MDIWFALKIPQISKKHALTRSDKNRRLGFSAKFSPHKFLLMKFNVIIPNKNFIDENDKKIYGPIDSKPMINLSFPSMKFIIG